MPGPSDAWIHGNAGGSSGSANLNGSVINAAPIYYNNLAKGFGFSQVTMNNKSANGYPVTAPSVQEIINTTLDQSYFGHYIMSWTGTGAFFMAQAIIVYNPGTNGDFIQNNKTTVGSNYMVGGNVTIDGLTGSGATSPTIEWAPGALIIGVASSNGGTTTRIQAAAVAFDSPTYNGQTVKLQNIGGIPSLNGTFVATFVDSTHIDINLAWPGGTYTANTGEIICPNAVNSTTWYFPTTGTYSGMDGFVLCKSANLAAVQAGLLVDQKYIDQIKTLKPSHLRFMDYCQAIASQDADFSARCTTSRFSWSVVAGNYAHASYIPTAVAGINVTNTGSDAFTCSDPSISAWDGVSDYIDGAIVQGIVDVANTGTKPTLAVGGHPAKPTINYHLVPFSLSFSAGAGSIGQALVFRFTGSYFSGGHYDMTYTTVAGDVGNAGTLSTNVSNAMNADTTLAANNWRSGSGNPIFMPAAASSMTQQDVTYLSGPAICTVVRVAVGAIATGATGNTWQYSKLHGAWMLNNVSGLNICSPYELFVELCNRTATNCHFCWPFKTKQEFIGAVTSFFGDGTTGLTSGLKFDTEFTNEVWNAFGPPTYPRCASLGFALGWPDGGNISAFGWQATRTVLYAVESRSAWAAKGRSAATHRILGMSQVTDASAPSNTSEHLMKGTQIDTGSYPLYGSYGGWNGAAGTTYGGVAQTPGTRPIDKMDGFGAAPYWNTDWWNSTAAGIQGTAAANAVWLNASLAYAQGSTATSYQSLADQITGVVYDFTQRQATVGLTNLSYQDLYAGWYNTLSAYDAYRIGAGQLPIFWHEYEGGIQVALGTDPVSGTNSATDSIAALVAQFTALSWNVSTYVVSGTNNPTECATNVNAMFFNFKFSTQFKTAFKQRYINCVGVFSGREAHPGQYGYAGPNNIWSLYPGSALSTTPYSSFTAISEFNNTVYHYYEGLIASRTRMMHNTNTTFKQVNMRSAHIASENLSTLRVCFQNFWNGTNIGGQLADVGLGAATTIKAAVEYNSVSTPIWFGGMVNNPIATGTIPDGGTLWSNYFGCNIPQGATFWIRMWLQNSAGFMLNTWQNGVAQGPPGVLAEVMEAAASGLSDRTASTGTWSSGSNVGFSVPPLAVVAVTNNASVIILGDSRAAGQADAENSDTTTTSGFDGKIGNVARSLSAPFTIIAVSGEKASTWIADATGRDAVVQKGSHLVCNLGINDTLAGDSAATIEANLKTIYALARTNQKVYQITSEPDTTDSGTPSAKWTTLGQQTVFAQNSVRLTLNTDFRHGAPYSGNLVALTGFYDVASVYDLGNSKWRVDTVGGFVAPYTGDGVHANGTFSGGAYPSGNNGYQLIPLSGVVSPVAWP